jgi:hypothetical protein
VAIDFGAGAGPNAARQLNYGAWKFISGLAGAGTNAAWQLNYGAWQSISGLGRPLTPRGN